MFFQAFQAILERVGLATGNWRDRRRTVRQNPVAEWGVLLGWRSGRLRDKNRAAAVDYR
jgi:hypothetical protein